MRKHEFVVALVLCAIGTVVFLLSSSIPTMVAVERSSIVNSRFFPKLMSGLLVFFGLVLAAQNALTGRRSPTDGGGEADGGGATAAAERTDDRALFRLLGAGGLMLAYVFGFMYLGFLVSSVLFVLAFLWILGSRRWYVLILVSALVPATIYLLFRVFLNVMLPAGVLSLGGII